MKKLNPLKINFLKNSLIESSAGTGKTFTIIILYLRLLLKNNIKNEYIKKNINIKKILILTFTKYAKNQIYERIKETISNFKTDCMKNDSKNIFFKKIIKQEKCKKKLIKNLYKLEEIFDNSSILTIHQFCNKIIQKKKFFFKQGFYKKILENEDKLFFNAIIYFWRKNFYNISKEISKIIYSYWKEPKKIFEETKNIFKNNIKVKFDSEFEKHNIKSFHFKIIKRIIILKKICKLNKNEIKKIIKKLKKKKIGHVKILRYKNKINNWCKEKTKDYFIPKEIKQMIEIKNIKKYFLKNKKLNFLYKYIKKFFKKKFFMKEFIIYKILQKIPNIVKIEKKNKSIINFDDLVKIVKKKIKKNKNILLYLKKKYPVAIIDEFQDTDYDQQEILMKIYGKNNKKNIMIIFADPKQCIYDFRGSNILLYNKFKKKIKDKYFLDTNWRTSSQIIKFINNIFLKVKNPFVNKNIIFKKSKYTKKNNKIKIIVDKVEKKNFKIIFYKKSQINLEKYFAWSSKKCAKQIKKLLYLGKKKRAKIKYHNKTKFISKKDIAILVANKFEYYYIKKTLNKYKIKSYYQFKKINIYNEEETKEILILLKSIIDYSNKQKIINAISTKIISEDIKKIYDIQKNKTKLFKKIKEFKKYKKILKKTGILNLIKYIITKNIVKKNIFNKEKIEKYIKKYFYISKFLEKKMYKFKKINLLIHWLEIKINQKNVNKYKYFNKNEKMNGIKVISIHRSKGLEYPITIIPFIMHVSKKNDFTYYDIKTYTKIIDLKKNNKSKKKFLKEKILNNIKLLYVSLTRAIVHCTIIIGVTKNRKGSKHTDVHKSGIGYILQKKKKKNFLEFKKIIKNLKKKF